MKINSLINSFAILGGVAVLACTPAKAGDMIAPMDPGPVDMGSTTDNLLDPIETTLSSGFDTHYMFRGFDLGQEAVWTGIDFSLPFALPMGNLSLDFGAWYVNPTEGPANVGAPTKRGTLDDELDVYAGVSTTVGPIDVAVGYVHYFLGPDNVGVGVPGFGFSDQNEIGTSLGTSIGPIDLGLEYAYNFDVAEQTGVSEVKHYLEPSIGTGFEVNDRVSLNLSVAAGFYADEFSHLQFGLAAPIVIAENVILEPYIAYMDDHKTGVLAPGRTGDDLFGGISLSVSF